VTQEAGSPKGREPIFASILGRHHTPVLVWASASNASARRVATSRPREKSKAAIGFAARIEPRKTSRTALLRSVVAYAAGSALQYRLQYEAPNKLPGLYDLSRFTRKSPLLKSGADGIRTRVLRRTKADHYILVSPTEPG
jgi:hypothetical protein